MPAFFWPRRSMIVALLLFLAVRQVGKVDAKNLDVYDLDSLIYLSTDVIEAEIVRRGKGQDSDQIQVKVTLVHKGSLKKGQSVVVDGTSIYTKPTKDFGTQPLAVGDRLVFFVRPASAGSEIRAPAPGGMRFVQKDGVFRFSQWDNPGPYVANLPPAEPKSEPMTLASFRKKVGASLRDTLKWAKLLDAKADTLDVPRLQKLLAERSKQSQGARDYIAEQICIRFAETHDLLVLNEALPLAKGHYNLSILQRGFGTPEGRHYLLGKVGNAKEPMLSRLRYARALHEIDPVYRSTLTEIRANGHRHVGGPDEGNSGYITRIAEAARANGKHEALCASLVSCIDYFGQGIVQNKPIPMMADLRAAFAILKKLYETKPTQQLQFAIEKATAWDPAAYQKLNSPSGKFISILRAADSARYTKPAKRSLIFEYEYTTVLLGRDVEVQPMLVLVHQETKKRHVLPTTLRIRGRSAGGGSNLVELPRDIPKGRYRVFFQLGDGDAVTSTGHYFLTDQ